MDRRLLVFLSSATLIFSLLLISVEGQTTTAGANCKSTGPTCINEEDCATKPNGMYQWCQSCNYYLTCQNGSTSLTRYNQDFYPNYDDNSKSFQAVSSTCYECFFDCDPIDEPPPTGNVPSCEKTGPLCVPTAAFFGFCNVVVVSRRFQSCENCRQYINCLGLGNIHNISSCPENTIYDDVAKDCMDRSTTCVECYTLCNETFPAETTLAPPDEITIIQEETTEDTGSPINTTSAAASILIKIETSLACMVIFLLSVHRVNLMGIPCLDS